MTIYNLDWPKNYAEQRTMAGRILNQVKSVCARRQVVTVRSYIEPTQGEWETAYVDATNSRLPIPVGSPLVWLNLETAVCKSYSTLNDENNGMASSGVVRPIINQEYDRPSLRLLAVADSTAHPRYFTVGGRQYLASVPAYAPPDMVGDTNSGGHLYDLAKKGLSSLLLVYKLRTNSALASNLCVTLSKDGSNYSFIEDSTNFIMSTYGSSSSAGGVFAGETGGVSAIVGRVVDSGGLAGAWSAGMMTIQGIVQPVNGLTPMNNVPAPQGNLFGTYFGTTFAAANTYTTLAAFIKGDELPVLDGWISLGVTNGTPIGKYWVYGIFESLTRELV